MKEPNELSMLSESMLHEALENAELLLNYATEHGFEIQKDWIQIIIKSKKCEKEDTWTTEDEIEFWMAYKELSKLVQPVSIHGLKAGRRRAVVRPTPFQTFFKIKSTSSLAQTSVRSYRFWTLLFILSVVIIQVITLKGTTTLNNIQSTYKRMNEVDNRTDELRLLMNADEDNERAQLEYYRLESEKGKLDQELSGSIELLTPWVDFLRSVIGQKSRHDAALAADTVSKSTMPAGGPGSAPSSKADAMVNDNVSTIQEAQNYTQIIQLYILPLLYGLIGGFIFVLRTLEKDIRTQVFSQGSNIKYTLRIHLGALAGLIVGLLWGDIEKQQITFLESLSTAGFAFVAGYGVEFLFDAIDRFVGSIGGEKKTNSPNPCK